MAHPWDRDDPLRQVEPETARATAALREYALMGPQGRSLEELSRRLKVRNRTLQEWSTRFSWQARVAAFDVSLWDAQLEEREQRRLDDLAHRRKLRRAAEGSMLKAISEFDASSARLSEIATMLSRLHADALADDEAEERYIERARARVAEAQERDKAHGDGGGGDDEDPFEQRLREVAEEFSRRPELGPTDAP